MDVPLERQRGALVSARSPLRHLDLALLLAVLGLSVYGLAMIYSSTYRSLELFNLPATYYLKRQAIFLVLGVVAMAVTAAIDYRRLRAWAPLAYAGVVLLLLAVRTPLGSSQLGAQRWFEVGGFQFTPSMFARLALIGMMAAYLSGVKGEIRLSVLARAVGIAAVPMLLVFVQPDIGTTIILAAIMVALLVVAGTRLRYLVVLAVAAIALIAGAFQMHVIKQYQIDRLTSFLDPSHNSRTIAYNLEQSEIAIGSGGVTGTGYLRGVQTNLDFVPEQYADFIFTVVGEEFGFAGAVVLLFLYGVVLWRAYRIAVTARDPFGTLLATGVAAMIAIQMFVNIGMTMGIMPITGIPLPFMSYGGSALISDFIGIGALLSIRMRAFQ